MGDGLFGIVLGQVVLMGIYMLAGGVSYWRRWIDENGVKQISNLLLYLVNPLTIIAAYQIEFSWPKLWVLGQTFCLSLIVLGLTFAIIALLMKRMDVVEKFAVGFANSGFIGIPLVKAVLSDTAVFHLSAFLVAANLWVWTYGIYLLTQDKKYMTLRKAIMNPGTIGTILGLGLFISPWKLPSLLFTGIYQLGNLNTPLAMIILGAYIMKTDVKKMFHSWRLYRTCLWRLIFMPLLTLLVLALVPVTDQTILMTIFIAISGPAAVNTMMFPLQFGGNSELGAQIVSMSSLLSMFSLPIILSLGGLIL